MPIGLEPHDERQRAFVESLRWDAATQRGADLVESSLESLKTLIYRKLTTSEAGREEPRPPDEPLRVYLIFDVADRARVEPIYEFLFNSRLEVLMPAFEGDEAQLARLHRDNLLLCDAALIYYDSGNRLWLQSKLTDLRKASGWGRATPMLVQAVFIAGQATDEKKMFRTHEAVVVRNFGEFDAESLKPFVDALYEARNARDYLS